jgi:hypothetical protein
VVEGIELGIEHHRAVALGVLAQVLDEIGGHRAGALLGGHRAAGASLAWSRGSRITAAVALLGGRS